MTTLFDEIGPEISSNIKVNKLNTIPFTPLDIKTNNKKGNLEDTRPNYISIDEDKKYGEDGIGKITCYNCGKYVKDLGTDNFIKHWNKCCKTGGGKYNQQYFKKGKPYININPIDTTKEQRKKWKEQQKHIEKNKNNFIMNKKFLEENINKIDNQTIQFGQINQLWPKIRSASRNREWSKGLVYLLLAFSILTASTTLDETTQQPGVRKLHVSIPGAIGDNFAFERHLGTDPRNYKDNNRMERRHRQEINKLREKLEKKLAEKKEGKKKSRKKRTRKKKGGTDNIDSGSETDSTNLGYETDDTVENNTLYPLPILPTHPIRNRSGVTNETIPNGRVTDQQIATANERFRRTNNSWLRNTTGDILERCTGHRCGLGGKRKTRRKQKKRKTRRNKRKNKRKLKKKTKRKKGT